MRCTAHCEPTCEAPDGPYGGCTRQCQPGCVCRDYLNELRKSDGTCVTADKC